VLKAEARALGWFILRCEVEPEFIERYAAAHEHLFTGPQLPADNALVFFATRHPRLLPCLDAASALLRPDSLLHKKALLMTGILEASPRYAEEFLPRKRGLLGLCTLFVGLGLTTAVQVAVGAPLLWYMRLRS
jgi:hypothetical protein